MKRNLSISVILIVLTLILAQLFGRLGKIMDPYLFFGGSWIIPTELSEFINGLPYAFLLLLPILFGVWGHGKKWLFIIVLSIPAVALSGLVSKRYLYWALVSFGIGIIVSGLSNLILRHINTAKIR